MKQYLPVPIYFLDGISFPPFSPSMSWNVEYTDEFGKWWNALTEKEQVDIAASVRLLEELGPNLGFPHSSGIKA